MLFRCAAVTAFLCSSGVLAQTGDVRGVHDPCIIRQDSTYYVFSTGRGRGESIQIRRSTDLRRWERIGVVFDDLPVWTREKVPRVRNLWAPDVAFLGGRYHLYYSVSSFGSNQSCIGLATNATLDPAAENYEWVDQGPVICTSPEARDNFNAIDPQIVLDEHGEPWMSLGSFWSGLQLVRLAPETGKRHATDTAIRPLATRPPPGAIEAPHIHRRDGWHYLFVSFDHCCRGVRSDYRIMVGRSKSLEGPYVDREGTPLLEGGGTLVLESDGHVRGPGHNAVLSDAGRDWLVHHFYDAGARGVPTLQIRPLTWDADGWPRAGEPVASAEGSR
ncbi:MAG TPA: arabinan endo-1,5-alpha-L-arabinosidase [Planctomycetaceae bacterium]|nr:arabinan endo-1,5-alpha-L-arabinosidase [Planctomycetaceae bacterium]